MSSQSGVLYAPSALRTPSEEFVGALSHGIGLVLSIAAGVTLVTTAMAGGDLTCTVGCCFYATTLVALYAASTLSHLYLPDSLNRLFRSLDQGCIYLLIVGSFTPFALTFLRTPFWLSFYALVLAVAVGGFLSKTAFAHRLDGSSIWLYVALSWGEGLAIQPLLSAIPSAGLFWIVAGGLCYMLGTIFLILDLRRYYFHAIWHLLVMAGSACHYVAILRFVAAGR
ncbi:MAG: hemolysin III family protein [Planctomycetota bacterium]|nr:hemolysin III family protein [Planctomycetota bacterium]